MKRCLSLQIYRWLKKIQWNSITRKRRFLYSLKYGRYSWSDYSHAKIVCIDFEIKKLEEYHDLRVLSYTLLLAVVFETFRNMCLEICQLDPARCLSFPGLSWQTALKKTTLKLNLLTDIDMSLMVKKKGITGGIYHSIYWYTKANNRYMKYYGKNKESSYIQYVYVNNLYSWAILQKLPVNISERIKDTSQFNEDFIKNYNEESDEGYFLKVDVY